MHDRSVIEISIFFVILANKFESELDLLYHVRILSY